MRITDIIFNIYRYVASIKVKYGNISTTTRTIIFADSISQAKALLVASYGKNSVLAVSRINDSKLDETVLNGTKHWQKPRVLPTEYTHDLVQKALVNQLKRNELRVKITVDDLQAARSDFEAEQKRANLEFERVQKWAAIRKRRLKAD